MIIFISFNQISISMKNIILSLILIGLSLSCISQQSTAQEHLSHKNVIGGSVFFNAATNNSLSVIQPGVVIVSSGFIGSSNVTDVKNAGYNFSPYYGRWLSDNFMLGAIGTFANSNSKTYGFLNNTLGSVSNPIEERLSETNIRTISYGLFARYYFSELNRFQFFLEPRLTRVTSNRENSNLWERNNERVLLESESDRRIIDLRILPGVSFRLSNGLNLLVGAGLVSYQFGTEENRSYSENQIGIIDTFSPSTGFLNEQVTVRDVRDFTLSLRSTSLFFSFEVKF